jgi:parvulin-like peptidyl-prolyl isomerase
MTLESYKSKVKEEIERAQLVNKEIRQRVNVSSAEIKRYYEAHLSDYATNDKVKVRAIFLRVEDPSDAEAMARARAKAEEIRAGARSSKAFQALAKEHSEGPGAAQGGELGTFARGEMEGRLEEVAFALKEGEVSAPIDTDSGVTLLFVEERIGGSHRPLDEVSPEIREALYNEALQQRFQDWLSRDLRERHHVEVLN